MQSWVGDRVAAAPPVEEVNLVSGGELGEMFGDDGGCNRLRRGA